MNLRDATAFLIRSNEIVTYVKLADSYIRAYNKLPTKFILPHEHAALKPVIESFAKDTAAFADYIKLLRDACDGTDKTELHELYRSISVRALQHVRRARLKKAMEHVLPKVEKAVGRPLSYEEQMLVSKQIEHEWGKLRMDAMDAARSRKKDRITTDERTEVLEEFWRELENSLEAGDVPLGRTSIKKLADLLPR